MDLEPLTSLPNADGLITQRCAGAARCDDLPQPGGVPRVRRRGGPPLSPPGRALPLRRLAGLAAVVQRADARGLRRDRRRTWAESPPARPGDEGAGAHVGRLGRRRLRRVPPAPRRTPSRHDDRARRVAERRRPRRPRRNRLRRGAQPDREHAARRRRRSGAPDAATVASRSGSARMASRSTTGPTCSRSCGAPRCSPASPRTRSNWLGAPGRPCTRPPAEVLGVPTLKTTSERSAVGAPADIVLLDASDGAAPPARGGERASSSRAGPEHVDTVIVDGRVVVRDGVGPGRERDGDQRRARRVRACSYATGNGRSRRGTATFDPPWRRSTHGRRQSRFRGRRCTERSVRSAQPEEVRAKLQESEGAA